MISDDELMQDLVDIDEKLAAMKKERANWDGLAAWAFAERTKAIKRFELRLTASPPSE